MFYSDYFKRIEESRDFNRYPYRNKISTILHNEKAKNLFQDCLSNHVDFDNPSIDKLEYNYTLDSTRYIPRDILSAYFINKIYNPPEILKYENNESIDYKIFIKNLTENSYVKNENIKYSLGSNRLRFIVGDVGEGKSALIKKSISTICNEKKTLNKEYTIISIYFNFEDLYNYGSRPASLKDDFYTKLYQEIQEKTEDYIDISDITSTSNIEHFPELVLKRLFKHLMDNKVQLIIFLDNIDFYHYYFAKYSYFDEYYKNQDEMINDNIMWLYSLFSKKSKLGDQGLNIVFSIRNYVYDDIISNTNGTDTEINTTKAYKIKLVNEDIVLGSRLQLLSDAIKIVINEHKKVGEDMMIIYREFRLTMDISSYEIDPEREEKIEKNFLSKTKNIKVKNNSPVRQISKIGQHGYRTLVQFFSSLNITYLDLELIDRFFRKQASTLRLLYFTNIYEKYSQEQNHFPNLFLNDCIISYNSDFKLAHKGHAHTYWLKYFILKFIVSERKVRFQHVIDIFHTIGGYDIHLIKHIVGSLGTANEFRCIEYDTSECCTINNRKLVATERGKYFYNITSYNVEHCFDIEYLQIAIEDKWLSIPKNIIDIFYNPNLTYSHLYLTGKSYIDKSIENLIEKSKSSLIFLSILKNSYDIEIKHNKPDLHKYLSENSLIPDLEKASQKIIISSEGVISAFKRQNDLYKIKDLKDLLKDLEKNEYNLIFKQYYENMTENKKVR